MMKKGFVFSLDAFFALVVFIIAFIITIYFSSVSYDYYYTSVQAKMLSSDILSKILSHNFEDVEGLKRFACSVGGLLSTSTNFKYAIYFDEERLDCSFDDQKYLTVKQVSSGYIFQSSGEKESPYKYITCSGVRVPCDVPERFNNVTLPKPIKVSVVVFI